MVAIERLFEFKFVPQQLTGFIEALLRGSIAQSLSRPRIQAVGQGVALPLREERETGAFGQILPQ